MSFGEGFGQDSGEAEPVGEPEATPQENSPQEAPPAEPQSDGHPAWAPLKAELGDFAFHKAQKYLSESNAAANKRITEVNSKYEPWKQFADQGVTPDMVSQAFSSLQSIQQDPVTFYNQLAEHLRSQGLLQEAAEAQAVADDAEDDYLNPPDERDKQIAELREQNERIMAWQEAQFMEQEQARINEQATQSLQQEMNALQQATNLAPEDLKVVLQRAHLYARADIDKSLQEVYDEIQQERSTVLTRPRPNDSAPRLPGVGGSAPTGNPAKRPEEFSRQESQAYLADLLRKENQAG